MEKVDKLMAVKMLSVTTKAKFTGLVTSKLGFVMIRKHP